MGVLLSFAAAINAFLLALALGSQSLRRGAKAGIFAALFLAAVAAAVMLIAADHAGSVLAPDFSAILEAILTFAAGPLFLLFVSESLGVRVDGRILGAALACIALASAATFPHVSPILLADRMVFAQMAFTAASAVLAAKAGGVAKGGAARSRDFVITAIIALCALHAAQILRTFWPDLAMLRDIVPAAGSLGLIALSAAVFFGGRLGLLDSLTVPPPVASEAMRALVARAEATLAGGLLKNPGLTAADAAAAVGASVDELAEAMRAVTGGGFAARVQQLRVEEAQRLLADPKEARTSMEAVGLLAGFGSRSAFYQAFSERVGMSPAAYRKMLASKPVQKPETGQV